MGKWVRVALASDLKAGEGKTVDAHGVEVALFNVDGAFRAIGNTCKHRGGPLGEGELAGTTVTCPWHGWQYDVTTGVSVRNPEVAVPSYRVDVRGAEVFLELP
jgi:nitrite reductase (NADH) small subunit